MRVLLHRLLTLDYLKAWALCEGIADYLAGPALLKENPDRNHRRVLAAHLALSPATLSATATLPATAAPFVPASWTGQLVALLGGLLWQLVRASPRQNARRLRIEAER